MKGCGRSGPNHPKSRCATGTVMPSNDHPDSSVIDVLSTTSVTEAESLEHEDHVPSFNEAQQLKATDFA